MNSLLIILMAGTSLLQPLSRRLEEAVYLTGSFAQTEYWALTLDSEVSSGIMHLAHPNRFLLQYSDSEGRAMGCTGTEVFTVDPVFTEILVYSGSPAGFLHILSEASENDCSVVSSEDGDSITVTASGLFEGGVTEITAGYTLSDSLPFFFSTTDANGNSTSWTISDLRISDSVPDIFSIPDLAGYSTVDAGTL
ncbi:MAG: outer membrane lipoprotein carrier protein LolA [Candidatus Sabulitectum sp.]|nr:outer membrane lipoprotein carrier protein LolA [Candidatus Sabulitectum sp.]